MFPEYGVLKLEAARRHSQKMNIRLKAAGYEGLGTSSALAKMPGTGDGPTIFYKPLANS
jgi:hypothetical protein